VLYFILFLIIENNNNKLLSFFKISKENGEKLQNWSDPLNAFFSLAKQEEQVRKEEGVEVRMRGSELTNAIHKKRSLSFTFGARNHSFFVTEKFLETIQNQTNS